MLILFLLAWACAHPAAGFQAQDENTRRDLKLEPRPSTTPVTPPRAVPRGYAVVIGIAKYKNLDPSQNLDFPESDAEAIYRVLISQDAGAFPPENVHKLIGSQATLANIRHELEDWLPSVAQSEDRVVVYFAGHGLVDHQRGYLAAWDVAPGKLDSTAYPMSALGDVLANKVKAHWKVLLTDACHSGRITPETTDEQVDSQLKNLPRDFLTLTATTARESSYETKQLSTGFGVFTYFLVQAWKGYADVDPCDGILTADELIEYVRTNVKEYVREHVKQEAGKPLGTQTPTASGDYAPDMVLGVNRACIGTTTSAPSMVGTAVIEANMDVDVYIDGNLVGKLSAGNSLRQPLSIGLHKVDGVKQGYETDHKEVMIAPGQEATVTLRIRYAKSIKKTALDLGAQGEKLLNAHRSSLNLLRIEGIQGGQSQSDLQQARRLFTRALDEDANYSTAAFDLGEVDQLLSDEEGSIKAYRRAIGIDASYVDARLQLSAVLIENGDADAAIRELTEAIRLEPRNDQAFSMLARAYWDKGVWDLCVENAAKAIALNPASDQAYLWKADATRQQGAALKDTRQRARLYQQARDDYKTYLDLTNYSTPVYSWVAFHFIGFGLGSRHHADRGAAYNSQRSTGFLGLCLCDQKLGDLLQGRDHCQRALKYDASDPIAYFELGNIYRDLFNASYDKGSIRCDYMQSARDNYAKMLRINGDLAESRHAKTYIEDIDTKLPLLRKKGCSQSPVV